MVIESLIGVALILGYVAIVYVAFSSYIRRTNQQDQPDNIMGDCCNVVNQLDEGYAYSESIS